MVFKDYYKILGLETNRVSMEEIKIAYRGAAKKYHPDLNVGNKMAEERIKDINEAYKTLSEPASKRKYDRKWNSYIGSKTNLFEKNKKSKEILKNMFFGNEEIAKIKKEQGKPIKGEDIETSITTSIYEAFYGLEKKISLKNSEGKLKTFSIFIPEGIKQGEKIRLKAQGKEGKNGGLPGDLIIKIDIKDDNKYKLKKDNLYTELKITPWEAVLGARIKIDTIDNEETKIYIPQGTQSGETVTIPGKGYKNENNKRGDLIAKVKIMVPKKLSNEEKNIYQQLEKISKYNPR